MKNITILFVLLSASFITQAKTHTDTPSVLIYPNPNAGQFEVQLESNTAETVGISIYNLLGQLLLADSVNVLIGQNVFPYNLSTQQEGLYIVKTAGQNWIRNTKMAIVKPTPTRSDSFDILHYDLSLSIQNLATKTISGTAKVKLTSKVNGLQNITLDLLKLNVTNVTINNVQLLFSQTDSTLSILFPTIKQQNDTFELYINYNGMPVTDPQWGGFYFSGNYAYNMGVAFKNQPHNFGRCWFPCIDNFTDRATYSFHITTDPTFKAVCNGLMLPETPNNDGSTTWNWDLAQPIPTYLASVAVGKYELVKYEFVGINRTYPIWLAVVAADTTKAKASFAKLQSALQCFEQKYGAYPFDRIGYVGVPFNAGAMEHATNIAYPNYAIDGTTNYETLFAHELSHMWWGDLATCRTAEDMWLNEGWASFNEALFLECVYGKVAYANDIKEKSIEVLLNAPKTDGGWFPVSGIPQTITYGTHVYKKGALMVHTLRTLMGDSAFFAASKSYLAKYSFKDVSSEDLKNVFQQFTSINLTHFFQKWIYSPGHSDVVVSKFETSMVGSNHHYRIELSELQRKNNLIAEYLPVKLYIYKQDSVAPVVFNILIINGKAEWEQTFDFGETIVGWSVNEGNYVQLGSISELSLANVTGNVSLPNVLFSYNVQSTGTGMLGPNKLLITHHWVGPLEYNLKSTGIRISAERYWTIGGQSSEGFKSWGFFNYNGANLSYLDSELINKTEDSLVLLYRASVNDDWVIHTDNTYQPGASKTDKIGRFWVNDLHNGEYAFGMRDKSVVGLKTISTKATNTFSIQPNPTSENILTLTFENRQYLQTVEIIDAKGNLVKSMIVNKQDTAYNLPLLDITIGNYFIVVRTSEGIFSKQFIRK